MSDSKPIGFSTNFQREVQAMLFLLNWNTVTREEIRLNLPKLGMELKEDAKTLPAVPAVSNQVPMDDAYPMADSEDGFNKPDDAVLIFIEENAVPDEIIAQLPIEAFSSVEALVRHIEILAQSLAPTTEGES